MYYPLTYTSIITMDHSNINTESCEKKTLEERITIQPPLKDKLTSYKIVEGINEPIKKICTNSFGHFNTNTKKYLYIILNI